MNERNSEGTIAKISNPQDFVKLKAVFDIMHGYFAFSPKFQRQDLRQRIAKRLSALYKDGSIKKINEKYQLKFENNR